MPAEALWLTLVLPLGGSSLTLTSSGADLATWSLTDAH